MLKLGAYIGYSNISSLSCEDDKITFTPKQAVENQSMPIKTADNRKMDIGNFTISGANNKNTDDKSEINNYIQK